MLTRVRSTLLALLFFTAARGGALCAVAPWYSCDFNSYTDGDLAGQNGWTGMVGKVWVQQGFAVSGKAIKANYRAWGSGEDMVAVTSGGGTNYVDMDVAMDITRGSTGYEGANLGKVYIRRSDAVEITRVYLADNQIKVRLVDSQPVVLTPVPNRAWIHIRLVINLTTNKMDVVVNGNQVLTGGTLVNSATSIGQISFGQWDNGNNFTKSETYMDNLVCSTPVISASNVLGPYTGWERNQVANPFVMYDSGTGNYKMYYTGTAGAWANDSAWGLWHIGLATSSNAQGWGRVNSRDDAVLYSTKFLEGDLLNPDDMSARFDSIWAAGPCVIRDGSTCKMWYTGWNGDTEPVSDGIENKIDFRIGYATSADGMSWAKYAGMAGAGAVLGLGQPGTQDSKGVGEPHVLREGSTYRMWYEGFDGSVWRVFYATSPDGINWTRGGVALNPGGSGTLDALGARHPVVIARKGQYELWYQGKSAAAPNYHVMRATSPDGSAWTKIPGEIEFGPPDLLDGAEDIYVDSILVESGDACRVYFAKQNTSSWEANQEIINDLKYLVYMEVVNP
ncbi:MAG: hypothetical protein Q7T82_10335 [Armatimonadota bacterium]|nr:hypothetical protein [Armatimonadota bacterium]